MPRDHITCKRCHRTPTVTETKRGNEHLSWVEYKVICTHCGLAQDGAFVIRENAVKAWGLMEIPGDSVEM